MEQLIFFVHILALACIPLAALAVIIKTAWIIVRKGIDLPAIIISFFRIYNAHDMEQTGSKRRRRFMSCNNWLNYFIYFTLGLFLIMLIIYKKSVLDYH